MHFLLILVLFCAVPFAPSYANQDVAEAIKTVTVQGINMSMRIDDISVILAKRGFVKDEVSSQGQDGIALYFNKGSCSFMISENRENGLPQNINYKCKNMANEIDAIHVMNTMCRIKNNGKMNRRGCKSGEPGGKQEIFDHPEAYADGYKYNIMIAINSRHSSSVTILASKVVVRKGAAVPQDNAVMKAVFTTKVSGASFKQIAEANEEYKRCSTRPKLHHVYDCSCYAEAFLNKRLEVGYQSSVGAIEVKIASQCLSVSEAGYKYAHSVCMARNFASKADITRITPQEYCTCYVEKWSDLVGAFTGKISVNQHSSMRSLARGQCSDLWSGK